MDDDWCLLSDDDEFVTIAPSVDDQVDPEPEPLAATLSASAPATTTATTSAPLVSLKELKDSDCGVSLDDIDISTLLQDSPALRTPPPRTHLLSLLTPDHRSCRATDNPRAGRCVEVHSRAVQVVRKRSGKLAFSEPRALSFPDRLRAAMPSRRTASEAKESVAFTPVTAVTRDQGTQVDLDAALEAPTHVPEPRAARLQSALERNMQAADALKRKSQDNERLAVKLLAAESQLERSAHQHTRDVFKLERLESGLALAKRREQLLVDAQTQLTAEIEQLRSVNAALERSSALAIGSDDGARSLAAMTIDELEQLETALAQRMDAVRAAVRAKYKQALGHSSNESNCVVCLTERATVQLLPCRHQVVCSVCALRVTTCPVDRERIHDRVLTFGLSAYE